MISPRGCISFPEYRAARCYMMPFIQGDPDSLPSQFRQYDSIIEDMALESGQIGLLTIDESFVEANVSQRGYGLGDRHIHTEACVEKSGLLCWGGNPTWGRDSRVTLEPETRVLIANSIDDTCALWDQNIFNTTADGDISHMSPVLPRETAILMKAGEVFEIGLFTPHEPMKQPFAGNRQFIRIVGEGVTGREEYFTINPMMKH